jgi:aromatic ring-opening dioxygenase catalytic subunit (LigB family)
MKEPMGDADDYERLAAWLRKLGGRYKNRIKALLVVSAHWEEAAPTVHFGGKPGLLYDYGGFPDYTYKLSWPAPGAPEVAARVEELLRSAGFETRREEKRGYDHGLFVPLMVAFPEAKVPVAQLSLVRGLDPSTHFAMGRALEPLRDEGILIVGSGMSYHNMRGFMSGDPRIGETSRRFDDWLAETVALTDPDKRREALIGWQRAPGGLECHPRSEHLVPLFIAAGAGGSDKGRFEYHDELMGVRISSHVFGED